MYFVAQGFRGRHGRPEVGSCQDATSAGDIAYNQEALEVSLVDETSELTRKGYLADVRAFLAWYAEREGRRSPICKPSSPRT